MAPLIQDILTCTGKLPSGVREKFDRIYCLDVVQGQLIIPDEMLPLVEKHFGPAERVANQMVVKVTNLVTLEQSLFNPLRSLRPQNFTSDSPAMVHGPAGEDPFASPLDCTTEEPFGRIRGKHCVTAGNVAKIDQYHSVIVFDRPDPLDFRCGEVADYIETGLRWMTRVHEYDPEARYGLFLWNCNSRAGASIAHGHAQAVMGKGRHYARVEALRRDAAAYQDRYGSSYFDDLYEVHRALGLGFVAGDARVYVNLAPVKSHEVMLTAGSISSDLKQSLYCALSCFRDRMCVTSFNVSIALAPLGEGDGWGGFPVVARVVSRGRAENRSSDISAMELWGANVVGSDPFEDAGILGRAFEEA